MSLPRKIKLRTFLLVARRQYSAYSKSGQQKGTKEPDHLARRVEKEVEQLQVQFSQNKQIREHWDCYVNRSVAMLKKKKIEEVHEIREARVPSIITLEVLSNGTTHLEPCLIIRTAGQMYAINCPEGTSRFLSSLRLKPIQIYDFLFTRGTACNVNGLSGVLLDKFERDDLKECRIHGPKGIKAYLEEMRPFLDSELPNLQGKYPVVVEELDFEKALYADQTLKIHYIPLVEPNSATDVAFLMELKEMPKRICPAKIMNLKIPFGPQIGMLKTGRQAILPDGRIIQPSQVHSDEVVDEKPNFLVVEVVSEEKLNSLRNSPVMQSFMNDEAKKMDYIVHFTPNQMFNSASYKEWMQTFGEQCEHIVVNGTGVVLPHNTAPYVQQEIMNKLCPLSFPPIYPQNFKGLITQDSYGEFVEPNVFVPGVLKRFAVRGALRDDSDQVNLDFRANALDVRLEESPEALPEIEKFKKYTASIVDRPEDKYPAIVFLGTASAVPTRYRNVSCNLVQLSDRSNIMIDCGEGSFGQMRVFFGPEECDEELLKLNAIFVTHSHQDHLGGIILLITKRVEAFRKKGLEYKPLILVSSRLVRKMLEAFSEKLCDCQQLVVVVDASLFLDSSLSLTDNRAKFNAVTPQRLIGPDEELDPVTFFPKRFYSAEEWNLARIQSVRVLHTAMSYAFKFTDAKNGRTLVFSGDTLPCDMLVDFGKSPDVLVHEATFEDSLMSLACGKKHSTISQAVDIGIRMNAKHIILNHFSARYNKMPPLPNYLKENGNISIAMDNMVVRFDRLDVFPKLISVFRSLFAAEMFNIEAKGLRREAKQRTLKRTLLSQ